MSDIESQLNRIEQLLIEGNRLRQQAIDLQTQAIERQETLQGKSAQLIKSAQEVQNRARQTLAQAGRTLLWGIPLLAVILLLLWFLVKKILA